MAEHPVRLHVEDDLERRRLTVFFRLLLAIPHFVWLFLWSIGAFVAVIVTWVAALATGAPPRALHGFLSRYVRYAAHVNAYVWLAAGDYPPFQGTASYAVDVELPEPGPQSRWQTLLRVVLAFPAFAMGVALGGGLVSWNGNYGRGSFRGGVFRLPLSLGGGALLATCAFLGWFASLARGRMPRGLRDANAYSIGYGAQLLSYVLLVTDRYPCADPAPFLADLGPPPAHPVRLSSTDDLRRSRVTTFFRLLLAVPHLVWLSLWGVAAWIASIPNWLVALVRGRPIEALQRFLAAYVRYALHVGAFVYLVGNPFPGFAGTRGSYPVDLELPEVATQSRWVTFFRLVLVVPAGLVNGALGVALGVAAFLVWFTGVLLGRAPVGLRNLGLYALRYQAQLNAYVFLLTERYPHASPLEGREPEVEPVGSDEPLAPLEGLGSA